VLLGLGLLAISAGTTSSDLLMIAFGAVAVACAVIVFAALRMVQQWEQAIVLRAGRFYAVKGPGLFYNRSDPRRR
jgi:regulator of protease activity HflC (stomatin/prohibitin superfamily)